MRMFGQRDDGHRSSGFLDLQTSRLEARPPAVQEFVNDLDELFGTEVVGWCGHAREYVVARTWLIRDRTDQNGQPNGRRQWTKTHAAPGTRPEESIG